MGLMNQPGWSYSAERAWYEPPEPWGSDDGGTDEHEMSLQELLEEMRKIAEKIHDDRSSERQPQKVVGTENVGNRRQ